MKTELPIKPRDQMYCTFISEGVGNGVHRIIKHREGLANQFIDTEGLTQEIAKALGKERDRKYCVFISPVITIITPEAPKGEPHKIIYDLKNAAIRLTEARNALRCAEEDYHNSTKHGQ